MQLIPTQRLRALLVSTDLLLAASLGDHGGSMAPTDTTDPSGADYDGAPFGETGDASQMSASYCMCAAVGRKPTPVHDTVPQAGLSETASYGCSVVEDSLMRRCQTQVAPPHAHILRTIGP